MPSSTRRRVSSIPSSRPTLDLIVQARLTPAASLAVDRRLLAEASGPPRERAGALRVYDLAGTALSLGRYHLAPPGERGGIALQRRLSGGRAVPSGEGFVGVALALPHRAALFADDAQALAPEQVMNRYVRGILAGLQLAGVSAYYPGRDVVTVGGRIAGLVSFEVDVTGALLFEAILAAGRDFSDLAAVLDAVDPGGVVPADMLTPADVTSVARERGGVADLPELADLLRRGYEERMSIGFAERSLDLPPAPDHAAWLAERRPRPDLGRHAVVRGQLGVLEAYCAVEDGRLGEVVLAGDFIAASETIAGVERALCGCAAERGAVEAVVRRVLEAPGQFVLGIGGVEQVADVIARAVGV